MRPLICFLSKILGKLFPKNFQTYLKL